MEANGTDTDIVVAGHICLDVIPTFGASAAGLDSLLTPGRLTEVGQAVMSTGGAVSNTGLALHRLGVDTRLMGKVGDDIFGQAILDLLEQEKPALAEGMIVAEGASSSYSIVLSPPNVDRIFLHSPGANNTFLASEVPRGQLGGARLFHFGYPPIMREMYADGGRQLADLFADLRAQGVAVSLDMSQPDPDSAAGQVDWRAWLARVLPHVDIFAPSFDEILYMLDRSWFEQLQQKSSGETLIQNAAPSLINRLGEELLELGTAAAALKLGDQGLYLRTAPQEDQLSHLANALALPLELWTNRQLLTPCFETKVTGTTGAGDTTVGGLLAGLLHKQTPEAALASAVGVGAFSVEAADATSGVPGWETVQKRIQNGWPQLSTAIQPPNWAWEPQAGLMRGPKDKQPFVESS